MKLVFFCHAFTSCWNNGNAHFLRGVTRELARVGHDVVVYEPVDGWSRLNAVRDGGETTLRDVTSLVPGVRSHTYGASFDLDEMLDGADAVIVHEWNTPDLIARIGRRRSEGANFKLLFHDTHHRAVTAPDELAMFELDNFDGVLAFGEVLREIYVKRGWGRRAFTWHEAADIELYRPLPEITKLRDVVWIGNWGDDERSSELAEFLVYPLRELKLSGLIHGVRYPDVAVKAIRAAGIHYGGWLPNHLAPRVFAESRATIHVPRGPYARRLPGIPTIRVFEALACGIPLVSAPWSDAENLFPSGCYLTTRSGEATKSALSTVLHDSEFAKSLANTGLRAVTERHTCRHRALELLVILKNLKCPEQTPDFANWRERIAS